MTGPVVVGALLLWMAPLEAEAPIAAWSEPERAESRAGERLALTLPGLTWAEVTEWGGVEPWVRLVPASFDGASSGSGAAGRPETPQNVRSLGGGFVFRYFVRDSRRGVGMPCRAREQRLCWADFVETRDRVRSFSAAGSVTAVAATTPVGLGLALLITSAAPPGEPRAGGGLAGGRTPNGAELHWQLAW